MRRVLRHCSLAAIIVLLTGVAASAQLSTADLSGRVTDSSGAVLPGVTVTVTQTDTGLARSTVTDETGTYLLTNLPTGPYRLEVSLAGFRTYVQTGIVLQVGATPTINAALSLGDLEETVTVEAATPLVDVRSAGISEVVENERIVELPLQGRQVTSLLVLAGAAVDTGAVNPRYNPGGVSISVGGGLAYGVAYLLDGAMHNDRELGESDPAQPGAPRIAPDGSMVAFGRTIDGNTDIWLMDTARATLRRFTVDLGGDSGPIWSPDGSRIVFGSDRRAGNLDLYEKSANGAEPEKLLLETQTDKNAYDWSPDGRFILYRNVDPKTGSDVWALPLFSDRKPVPVVQTAANEAGGRFSPDGRWIAYQSNESGRNEIYVQPFAGPGARLQISTEGGGNVQWRADGRELFYLSPDDRLMSSSIRVSGSTIEAGMPVALFSKPEGPYIASSDGQRFLVSETSEEASPITILLNWAGARR